MTTITALPTPAPSRGAQTNQIFSDAMDALLAALPTMISETNTATAAVDAALVTIAAQLVAAATDKGNAIAIAYTFSTTTTDSDPGAGKLRLDNATQNLSTTIRADLLDAAGATWTTVLDTFDDSTSTNKGQLRISKVGDATKWLTFDLTAAASPSGYRNFTAAVTGSSAASPFANNDAVVLAFTRTGDRGAAGISEEKRTARTSNTIFGFADSGKLIDYTSGTFTQTFDAAATLTNGWFIDLYNSGTGIVTLDPNAAETIGGAATAILVQGEQCRVQSDGANLNFVYRTRPTKVLQEVSVDTGANASGTTVIPYDDTIPQITEGDQYMSLAITPKSATSYLLVAVNAQFSIATAITASMIGAIFRDAGANAVGVGTHAPGTVNIMSQLTVSAKVASGSTAATTFTFRAGNSAGNSMRFNGNASRLFGGVSSSSIRILEIEP